MDLFVSLEGPDRITILREVYKFKVFQDSSPPECIWVDGVEKKYVKNWMERYIPKCKSDVGLFWDNAEELPDHHISYDRECVVKFHNRNFVGDANDVLTLIAPLPWTVVAFRTIHHDWFKGGEGYSAPGFANLHFSLGWGCAFKGEGHKRLVSRRILEFGPWHLIRNEENDITLVQFYDLNADSDTALEQAKPGHALMSKPFEGAFFQKDFNLAGELDVLYEPAERKVKVIVAGRNVPISEMVDMAKARYGQLLGPEKPIDSVAYIFTESEADARAHLHDLWLRELECWAFIDDLQTRIDIDYHPTPEKPEWVRQLESQ
jgi:hypothetical protein